MKRLLLAGVGSMALAMTPALAADVPPGRYMPPPRAPAFVPFFSWNGMYVGINAGYGFGHSKWTNTTTGATTGDFDVNGGVIGGTVGYNVQLSNMVVGLEADIAWSNIKGSTTTNCAGPCETSNNWLGTARGRIGYAFDRFLPYITAGAAFGDIKGTIGVGRFTETQVGWTAGLGVEYAFLGNLSRQLVGEGGVSLRRSRQSVVQWSLFRYPARRDLRNQHRPRRTELQILSTTSGPALPPAHVLIANAINTTWLETRYIQHSRVLRTTPRLFPIRPSVAFRRLHSASSGVKIS